MPPDMAMGQIRVVPPRAAAADDDTIPLPLAKRLFVMFGISIYSDAFTSTLRYARGDVLQQVGQTEISNTISQIFILSVLFIYVLRRWRFVIPCFSMMPLYVLTVLLCWVSVTWSGYPMVTLRRSVTLTVCIMFGVYCSIEVGMRRMIRMVAQTVLILSALSILVYFVVPRVGHDTSAGYSAAMRGVFSQKNPAGEAMLLGVICVCHNILLGRGKAIRQYAAAGFLMVCILLTLSATSLMIGFITITVVFMFRAWKTRWRPVALFAVGSIVSVLLFLMIFDIDLLFALIQRDASFTGRLPLWIESFQIALHRPIFGWGYSAFWVAESPTVQYLWSMVGWEAPSSHNGYLDIMLQIGLVGLGLYIGVWTGLISRSIKAIRSGRAPEAYWILVFMVMNLILNLDEGPLPYPDEFTMMMPLSLIYLAKWRNRQPRSSSRQLPLAASRCAHELVG